MKSFPKLDKNAKILIWLHRKGVAIHLGLLLFILWWEGRLHYADYLLWALIINSLLLIYYSYTSGYADSIKHTIILTLSQIKKPAEDKEK